MPEKLRLKIPVAVEGKYDKLRLSSVAEGFIIELGGFAVFNDSQKISLLRRICSAGKLIILTDSDSAGRFIRAKLKGYLPGADLINLYIPQVSGTEKRKRTPSKDGLLGVEGMEYDVLRSLLMPFCGESPVSAGLTKRDFYEDGFSGGINSSQRRAALAKKLGLPEGLTANALLEAVNLVCTREGYREARDSI